jgi:squalene-hopene/tetraprenyl-beta-curcumene cyclase
VQGRDDPGVTALVVAAVQRRPGGVGEEDRKRVDAALDWLVSLQKADGGIYEEKNANYTTSLAVQALAAAKRPADREVLERAVKFLRRMQFHEEGGEGRVVSKDDVRYGGMGYGSDPTQPDLSNTQFAVESLRAAGVSDDDPAMERLLVYLNRAQNRRENETAGEPVSVKDPEGREIVRGDDGGAGYRPFDSKAGAAPRPDGRLEVRSYGSMTYALLKCQIFAGLAEDDPRVVDAVRWIRENYTWEENPGFETPQDGQQGLFYYFATAARALSMLGDDAAGEGRRWRDDLGKRLLALQGKDGGWTNPNDRWMEGLPEVATAFALQALADVAGAK